MRETTAQCSHKEKERIRGLAASRGFLMRPFIGYVLNKHLPLDSVNIYDHNIERNATVGVKLKEELENRLEKNIELLSTDYKPVKLFEIVLTCVDLECGDVT